jgi:hypothetical protein
MNNPMEEVAKRMQGLKDSRSTVGELARGKNMYPGGNAAHSGPGGPDMGRPPSPTAVPQAAMDAVRQHTGMPAPAPQAPVGSLAAANPLAEKQAAAVNKRSSDFAKAALQAAAKRKMTRSK